MPRHFPNWLTAYTEYTAASEAPLVFHFWTGISTIASALRRRVWRDELIFQWTPNFYIIFVAPAGVSTKSTTLSLGQELLRKLENPDIRFAQNSGTWQALLDGLKDSQIKFAYIDSDGKPKEKFMSAITVHASELGTFLRPDDEASISFITDMWDGRQIPYEHRTKMSGQVQIENPWINLLGATTPDWMRRNVPENLIGEGLMSRIIFVYAEKKRHLVALPSQVVRQKEYFDLQKRLVEDLEQISLLSGPYDFAPEVLGPNGWMEKWYQAHNNGIDPTLSGSRFGGYRSRKQTHLVKVAIVLAAAQRDELLITASDLEQASMVLKSSEADMRRVFESVGAVEESRQLSELTAYVHAYQRITANDLYQLVHNTMRRTDFMSAVRNGLDTGTFVIEKRNNLSYLTLSPKMKAE